MTAPEPERTVRERAGTRATPLPEESAAAPDGGDDRAAAEEILRESEERVAGADTVEPADGADQRRRSEETL